MLQLESELRCGVADLTASFRYDVMEGLGLASKAIPARWLYDHRGSALFEAITLLPEYYPTRTERSILASAVSEISALAGPGRAVVEFGSGSSVKTRLLLAETEPSAYVPIDISGEFLREVATGLSHAFPGLPIYPTEADFTYPFSLPGEIASTPRLGFFPGSTIGNLTVSAAVDLLRAMAATLGTGSMLLIGIDRIKDQDVLLPAYDDTQGLTAAFNLNLLHRINRELGGSIPLSAFRHVARWDAAESRIEMHLEATRDVGFEVDGREFFLSNGETIHTENSFKYGRRDAFVLLQAGGWNPIADWTDDQERFSVILAEQRPARAAP
ncbi:L-histidine N(alpha)-methyltransferase [Bradyrhizobium sp. CCGB20]|uniref:L-histidine N(alpha)-methyltransferase n=1 Tax=Bradyrhizobium sp. CCGB20 TaxID=2949633 RepID=UPI0020B1AAEA|nr:L-histidine N(alpha)-methyltransferase [Bradyrhizobium sp. CCGB20]MCP3402750.1 L-histidine N(alpha)-methyltransferase [Bradyrhizobium sp. CCGB20]